MTKFKIEPLTNEIYQKFYADGDQCVIEDDVIIQEDGEGGIVFALAEGLALMDGDEPVYIAGVFFDEDGVYAASDFKIDRSKYKKTVYNFAIKAMEIVKKYPAIAIEDKEMAGSGKLLKKIGFIEIAEGMYQCPPC